MNSLFYSMKWILIMIMSINSLQASWYGGKFNGRKTANGEIFDENKLTCATNRYDFGDTLLITNLNNSKTVRVRVNDRISQKYSHRIDLSRGAFSKIASTSTGIINISAQRL